MRAWRAVRGDGAGEIAPGVVLGVLVADCGEYLRMGVDDVEGLHESLLAELPIAAHHLGHVRFNVALLWAPDGEMGRQVAHEVRQRLGFHVHVDEHPARPGLATHRRQREVAAVDLREIPLRGDAAQAAV